MANRVADRGRRADRADLARALCAGLVERRSLLAEGVWPEALPAPRAFMETIERRSVAVVDLRPPPDLGVSVAQERAIQRAIQGTAELAGAQAVVFLRHGAPAETLLGHVAVPSAL